MGRGVHKTEQRSPRIETRIWNISFLVKFRKRRSLVLVNATFCVSAAHTGISAGLQNPSFSDAAVVRAPAFTVALCVCAAQKVRLWLPLPLRRGQRGVLGAVFGVAALLVRAALKPKRVGVPALVPLGALAITVCISVTRVVATIFCFAALLRCATLALLLQEAELGDRVADFHAAHYLITALLVRIASSVEI